MSGGATTAPAPPRRSVRGKLVRLILETTALGVFVAGAAMVTYDLGVYRASWVTDLANEALVLGVSVAPALEFNDEALARRNLAAMQVRQRVLAAALYTSDGRLYASYSRDADAPPPVAPPYGESISGERVELCQPVGHGGEPVGSIYLRAQYDVVGRLAAYAVIFAAVMGFSLAVAYVLSRRLDAVILDPLRAMTDTARHVVDTRDYSRRVSQLTDDEIGIAVLAFNGMLAEVESRSRISEAANTALQAEVQVRKAAEAALRDTDRRKDEFLATLAHELRNPLAPIRHAVKLLDAAGASVEQQRWGRSVIGRQVQRMALLLDDLLDVSRITRGQLRLKIDRVALRSVVEAAVEVARPLIQERRQHLGIALPDQPLRVDCDPLRLSQSLSNLLTNAAKYTDKGGTIGLTVALDDAALTFAVRDSGIGIDPAAIPALFEIFSQLNPAIDRSEGGLGIGLALVKGLVELHGGTVGVASAGVGKGSEFTIALPRAAVSLEPGPPAREPGAQPPRPDAGYRILLADDNRDAVDSLALLLHLAGFEVIVAYSGDEAFRLAQQDRPAVLLLDIGMPGMTGYEVASSLRRVEGGEDFVLVAITGWGQAEDQARARAAGFDHHLTKPVNPDELETLLDRLRSDVGAG